MARTLARLAAPVEVAYHPARMLRISWPLAALLAFTIAVVARKPRLLPWMLVVFGLWFVLQAARGTHKR